MDLLDKLAKKTIHTVKQLFQDGYLENRMISNYNEMSKRNLHSWLQYAAINAGEALRAPACCYIACLCQLRYHQKEDNAQAFRARAETKQKRDPYCT